MELHARLGDTVTIHYRLAYMDGRVFVTTYTSAPLTFLLGGGVLIPGLEKSIIGMRPGEHKTVILSPEDAFGPHVDELVQKIPKTQVPSHIKQVVGQKIEITLPDNQRVVAIITDVTEDYIIIDGNPYQAGKSFRLTVELIQIS